MSLSHAHYMEDLYNPHGLDRCCLTQSIYEYPQRRGVYEHRLHSVYIDIKVVVQSGGDVKARLARTATTTMVRVEYAELP